MAPTALDRKWMKAPLGSEEYLDGVEFFLKFIRVSLGKRSLSSCPCFKCRNVVGGMVELKVIAEHLIMNGVDQSYTSWYFHGEPIEENDDVYVDKFDEVLRQVCLDDVDDVMDEVSSDENFGVDNEINEQSTFSQTQTKFGSLWEDVRRPIYPLCKEELTKLSVTVELMSIKTKHQMSDNCFTDLLSYMRKILPEDNTLPHTVYEAKCMIKALGLEYETIHACPNDCMIYWSEDTDRQSCSKCGTSRWKTDEAGDISNKKSSSIPAKVFRYFPLIPRLQRLYSVPWIAENMTWHSRVINDENKMRHPVDSDSWSLIDAKWPTFSKEPRNVRLGLAVDGFNPFSYNSSYTCCPVMIVPYNLPPSICMNKEFIMLSTLIHGKNGPGKDIDVYLKPLVFELKLLWSTGTVTFDSHTQTEFVMKAVLLWAIHDLPAYSSLSCCRCGGKYGCPMCAEETYSIRLKHGNKNAYMGTRRNLPSNHPFRFQKRQFDGLEEHLIAPRRLSGSEVLNKVSKFETKYGKEKGKKSKKSIYDNGQTTWSKKSILFELPYWEDLEIRHNLDVMHVERNVAEILISTIMETDKSKDGTSARLDLKEMNIKSHLWPNPETNRCPKAPFTLSQQEKELFLKSLSTLKVPIGYSSNWKDHVNLQDLELKGLKSHDYHILMQQLLSLLLMHGFKEHKPLLVAIRQVSTFFNVLCSKVIYRGELDQAGEEVIEALCVFEKYFPPSFFVVMIHLVVHLAEEAQINGPVRFRWMYVFERMIREYKKFVKNPTHPEGCIAERYIIDESIRYCLEHMPGTAVGSHKQRWMDDMGDLTGEEPLCTKGMHFLNNVQYEQARRWVLQCSKDVVPWRMSYNTYLEGYKQVGRKRKGNIGKPMDFIPWLRKQLEHEEMSVLKRLADGPHFQSTSYNSYKVNGYMFSTYDFEERKTTQNSGVKMKAFTNFRASARDKNLVEDEATYYGVIRQILELNYFDFRQTVFYCDWVRIEDKVHGCRYDPEANLTSVNLSRFRRGSSIEDEPFILASQASQVFYCKEPTTSDWSIVLDAPKRLSRDVDAYGDPLAFDAKLPRAVSGSVPLDT